MQTFPESSTLDSVWKNICEKNGQVGCTLGSVSFVGPGTTMLTIWLVDWLDQQGCRSMISIGEA